MYASSSEQLTEWIREFGASPGPVKPLPIQAVLQVPSVEGPEPSLTARIRELHTQNFRRKAGQ